MASVSKVGDSTLLKANCQWGGWQHIVANIGHVPPGEVDDSIMVSRWQWTGCWCMVANGQWERGQYMVDKQQPVVEVPSSGKNSHDHPLDWALHIIMKHGKV